MHVNSLIIYTVTVFSIQISVEVLVMTVILCLFLARPTMSTSLSGYPVILVCSQKPTVPVSWTFRHFSDSEVENIITNGSVVNGYSERFGILGTSLINYKVQQSDDGLYNCSDANGNIFTHNLTILGKKISRFSFYHAIILLRQFWLSIVIRRT